MNKKKTVCFLMIAIFVIIFLVGAGYLYSLRYRGSDIYPVYSSFRGDRLGTKALYDSLAAMKQLSVSRNLRPINEIDIMKNKTLLVIGLNSDLLRNKANRKEIDEFVYKGGRVVISFSEGALIDLQKWLGVEIEQFPRYMRFPYKVKPCTEVDLPPFYIFSKNCFNKIDKTWRVLYPLRDSAVIIEKKYPGGGSIILCADSYTLSNEGLANHLNSSLLIYLLGGNSDILFDETHLGGFEKRNIVWLAGKYNLLPFIIMLVVTFLLMIWRRLLITSAAPSIEEEHLIEENFANSSLVNILKTNIPKKNLLKECWSEFYHSSSMRIISHGKYTKLKELESVTDQSLHTYNMAVDELNNREGLNDE